MDRPAPTADEFAALTARVYALERQIGRQSESNSERQSEQATAPPAEAPVREAAALPIAPFEQGPSDAPAAPDFLAGPGLSFEARVGAHWFSRVGIAACLIGAAWLFKWASDNGWIGPAERVCLGLLAGLGAHAWGEALWRRFYSTSAYAMFGLGNGLLYLSLWASFALYHLVGSAVVFVPMVAITAWNGVRSYQLDSPPFATYALLLGYSIPLLLANGENHEIELFFFLLLLDAAVALLAVAKPWRLLLPSALAATALLGWGWAEKYFDPSVWLRTDAFILAFAALFVIATTQTCRRHSDQEAGADASWLAALALLIALVSLLLSQNAFWLQPWQTWSSLLLSGFALTSYFAVPDAEAGPMKAFRLGQYAVTLALITVALALHFSGRQLLVAWTLEGMILARVGTRWVGLRSSRGFSLGTFGMAWLGAILFNRYAGSRPLLNPAIGVMAVAVAALAVAAWICHGVPDEPTSDEPEILHWPLLANLFAGGAILLIWIMGLRAISVWWWGGHLGYIPPAALRSAIVASQFSYSAWCMVYGAILLIVGFWRRLAPLRWAGLLLVGLAIAKVFIYDVDNLSQGFRVLSFFGLGGLLLAISFAYQKDWLRLRG